MNAEDNKASTGESCRITSFSPISDVEIPELSRLTDAAHDLNLAVPDLSPAQFNYCLGEKEQYSWTNVPGARSGGVRIGDLSTHQQEKVWHLLQNFLSQSAYDNIYFLAAVLEEASGAGPLGDYTVALFGTPASDSAWGFQFDGHHIALNFVVDANSVILSPAFVGSRPTTVNDTTPLSAEIEKGRHFIDSLTSVQKESAFVPKLVRRDVLVGSGEGHIDQGSNFDANDFDQIGLPFRSLNEEQKTLFRQLLSVYVYRLNSVFASNSMDIIEEHLDSGFFVYSTNRDRIYYRIFVKDGILIEYSDVASDHVHTVVRLLGSRPHVDYGGFVSNQRGTTSMIVNHLLTSEHHKKDLQELFAISNRTQ